MACAVSPLGPSPLFYRSKSRETDGQAGGKEKENNIKGRKKMLGFWPMPRNLKYNRKLINLKA